MARLLILSLLGMAITGARHRSSKEDREMNTLKTALGLSLLTLAFVLFGRLAAGQTGMLVALALAAVTNLAAYFFSDSIVLSMYGARELSPAEAPQIHRMVEELAAEAGIPKPGIYGIPSPTANAFATGRGPGSAAVAVTQGITSILTPRELRGVLAHEIAHIVNRDVLLSTLVATLVGALAVLADMVRWSAILGTGHHRDEQDSGVGALVGALVLPIVATLVQLFISRQREFAADELGATLSRDPMALAQALQRLEGSARAHPTEAAFATAHLFIVNPLTAQGLAGWFSTHPPTRERVERLVSLARAWPLAA